ncbi:hypothetical protein GQ44DRAFT_699981 [Phaeosphaeriaceae sp. PMI808]|nr:hypothetical protein GQ44DRAFT_699981 [Phaeosphaeriaceae sp. PMI808]
MKYLLLIPTLAVATSTQESFYNITSKPFKLAVASSDGSISDTLSACHTGAAYESLCLSNSNSTSKPNPLTYSIFNFNNSIYSQAPAGHTELGVPGILTWFLETGNAGFIPSSVFFNYDPTTDLAVPILRPGSDEPQMLAFDAQDRLIIQGYVDWKADPPKSTEPYGLMMWYACKTYFAGYQYVNLAWGLGAKEPENPTCVSVSVKREFL